MPSLIRVLLADDHAVVRAGIRQFLEESADIEVIAEADDGAAAKSLIHKHNPDVAVLDIRMPHATGIDVATWVRQNELPTKVIILTAYDDDPYVESGLKAGADGFMLKTASPLDIIAAVRNVHGGETVLSPEIARKLVQSVAKPRLPERLSQREIDVLVLVAKGYTNKTIGSDLNISSRTVQGHLANIYAKLNVNTRTQAVLQAGANGWIEAEDA